MTMRRNIAGQRFAKFTVTSDFEMRGQRYYWRCRCDCGQLFWCRASAITTGNTQSCGCHKRAASRANGKAAAKHGLWNHPLYRTWVGMVSRCHDDTNASYARYGGRGVAVCDEWRDSPGQFIADMEPRPSDLHTLERRDNDGPYSKDNCCWATRVEQANNRRSSLSVDYLGKTRTLAMWARQYKVPYHTAYARYVTNGWSIERTLTEPVQFGPRPGK